MRKNTKEKRKSDGPRDPADFTKLKNRIKPAGDYDPEMKLVLYGKAGTGKTTLAASFPKPLLIDISERGSDSVRDIKGLDVIRVRDWQELEMTYWYLKKNDPEYETVIVDTVSYAQELVMRHVLEEKGVSVDSGELGKWGSMTKRDWGTIASTLKTFLTNLRDLDMNVVFIAHDRIFNAGEEDDEADGITPSVGPRLMPSVASALNAAVSVIGNTFIRERFKLVGEGKKQKEKRIVEYCLRLGPHSYYITKIRKPKSIEAPNVLVDPSYDDIRELMLGKE